jgi:tRNA(His) guanylyltransferase
MPKFDKLGDHCKWEEQNFGNSRYLNGELPIIARVDGKGFSRFTKGLIKPFDEHLVDLMIHTTKFLVAETSAVWGFCQSDEISLCLLTESPDSQVFFDGKTQKIVSVLASLTTAYFNANKTNLPERQRETLATFDCRAFNVPSLTAAVRQYIWRENDATRNSLSMLAQANFPHSVLQGKKRPELHDLLKSKNINWNDLPSKYKRGTIVRRTKRRRL